MNTFVKTMVLLLMLTVTTVAAYTTPDGVCNIPISHTVQVKQYNLTDSNLDLAYTATGVTEHAEVAKACYIYNFILVGGKAYKLCMKDVTAGTEPMCWTVASYQTYVDAATSSRSTYAGGAVASVTAPVTVGTNSDKTGYTVSTVQDKTGYTVSTVSDKAGYSLSITPPTAQNIWEYVTRTLTSAGSGGATAQEVWEYGTRGLTDKAGFTLTVTPPTAAQIRTEMDSNSTKLANLDATVSSRSTYAGGAVASVTGAVGSVTAPVTAGTVSDKTGYTVSTVSDKTGYSLSVTPPTAADIADAVWDEAISGHTGAGSTGNSLSTASSGGVDPSILADAVWDEIMSGHTTAGSAGKIIGDNLDATVSSRSTYAGGAVASVTGAVGSVTAPVTAGTVSDKTGYTVSTVSDKTGYSLSVTPPTSQNIWEYGTRTLTSAGSGGATLAEIEASTILAKEATLTPKASQTSVNSLGSPMQASSYAAPDNAGVAEIKAKTDQLIFVNNKVDANASVSLTSENIAEIAAAVNIDEAALAAAMWNEATAGHTTPGTAGYILGNYSQGSGNTAVNHNTGGSDNLRYTTGAGAGISGAVVKAYLKTDYVAGHRTDAYVKGRTVTDVNGRWMNDLHLDAGYTYTILFYKAGSYGPNTREVTLP